MKVLILALLVAIMPVAVCVAEEAEAFDMGAASAEVEGGFWDDLYLTLEVQGGTTYDFASKTSRFYAAGKFGSWHAITGVIGTEFDTDEDTPEKGPVTGMLGVTYQLGSLSNFGFKFPWAEKFGVNVGACGTYEFQTGDIGFRGLLSIDASVNKGNAAA